MAQPRLGHDRVDDSLGRHVEVEHEHEVARAHHHHLLRPVVYQEGLVSYPLQEVARFVDWVVHMPIVIIADDSENLLSGAVDSPTGFDRLMSLGRGSLPHLKRGLLIIDDLFPLGQRPLPLELFRQLDCSLDLRHVLRLVPVKQPLPVSDRVHLMELLRFSAHVDPALERAQLLKQLLQPLLFRVDFLFLFFNDVL